MNELNANQFVEEVKGDEVEVAVPVITQNEGLTADPEKLDLAERKAKRGPTRRQKPEMLEGDGNGENKSKARQSRKTRKGLPPAIVAAVGAASIEGHVSMADVARAVLGVPQQDVERVLTGWTGIDDTAVDADSADVELGDDASASKTPVAKKTSRKRKKASGGLHLDRTYIGVMATWLIKTKAFQILTSHEDGMDEALIDSENQLKAWAHDTTSKIISDLMRICSRTKFTFADKAEYLTNKGKRIGPDALSARERARRVFEAKFATTSPDLTLSEVRKMLNSVGDRILTYGTPVEESKAIFKNPVVKDAAGTEVSDVGDLFRLYFKAKISDAQIVQTLKVILDLTGHVDYTGGKKIVLFTVKPLLSQAGIDVDWTFSTANKIIGSIRQVIADSMKSPVYAGRDGTTGGSIVSRPSTFWEKVNEEKNRAEFYQVGDNNLVYNRMCKGALKHLNLKKGSNVPDMPQDVIQRFVNLTKGKTLTPMKFAAYWEYAISDSNARRVRPIGQANLDMLRDMFKTIIPVLFHNREKFGYEVMTAIPVVLGKIKKGSKVFGLNAIAEIAGTKHEVRKYRPVQQPDELAGVEADEALPAQELVDQRLGTETMGVNEAIASALEDAPMTSV